MERKKPRLDVYTTRTSFYPRWWQFRRQIRWRRTRRRVEANHKKLNEFGKLYRRKE